MNDATSLMVTTLNLHALEQLAVTEALDRCNGRICMAAKLLGITRHQLRRRLVRWLWVGSVAMAPMDQIAIGLRLCAGQRCNRLRTEYARGHWRCSCGHSVNPPGVGQHVPPMVRYQHNDA